MTNTTKVSEYAIGIDLGTTYSCVAVYRNGRIEIIDNEDGNRTTPSYVAFTRDERLVGEAAKKNASEDPSNTVYDVKRLIGRRFDDQKVKEDLKRWPFKVVEQQKMPEIEVTYKKKTKMFKPEEISAMVLGKMKQIAEAYLEEKVTRAVITVPAYFNDSQRKATIDAGKIAGLEVLRIINEPTAAGYCYGMDKMGKGKRNVLIYDLGGGTFDVTVLNIDNGQFTVKSTAGNSHLGGEDFDNLLVDYCIKKFQKKHGTNVTIDQCARQIIRSKCETAKITLSSSSQSIVKFDYLFDPIKFSLPITRALFEQLCDGLFRSTLDIVDQTLLDSGLSKSQIEDIVLVGGSTRIPKVQKLLQKYFNGRELRHSVNPDLAVASGAAIQAALLNQDNCQAIQNLKLCDVTPLSLGVRVVDGRMSTVVNRNTPIPTEKQKTLFTAFDYQTECLFPVYEGERALTKDNNFLGEFMVKDIPPAPEGVEKFTCTFQIDENGILSVNAVNHSTGNRNEITITNNGKMSREEIDRKIAEAETFRIDDENVKQKILAKNNLENFVYQLERDILEYDAENYEDISDKLDAAKELLDGEQLCDCEQYDNLRIELQRLTGVDPN